MITKKRGFTLIELLVAVSIFSGVVVLTLAAFARSADSSIRSSVIRERTQAARTIVDRIGNDIHYLYLDKTFSAGANECTTTPKTAKGLNFSNGCLIMLLKYPGTTATQLVVHRYARVNQNNRESIYLEESNGCSIVANNIVCTDPDRSSSTFHDVISSAYAVADDTDSYYSSKQLFTGITPFQAEASNVSPILTVRVVVEPSTLGADCSESASDCYTIETSFVPGG